MSYAFYLLMFYSIPTILGDVIPLGKKLSTRKHQRYVVNLEIENDNEDTIFLCSGTIIASEWIVTSASCLQHPTKVTATHIVDGKLQNLAGIDVSNIILHPDYDDMEEESRDKYNIALLKIAEPIKFDKYTRAVKLAKSFPKDGKSGILAGFGNAEDDDLILKAERVTMWRCEGDTLCTFTGAEVENLDSGSPLMYKGRLVGVLSSLAVKNENGYKCYSTFYADVYSNLKWLEETMMSLDNYEYFD